MPRRAALKIHSRSGIRVADVVEVLTAADDAYNAIFAYDGMLDSIRRVERRGLPPFYIDLVGFPFHWEGRLRQLREWPPKPDALRTLVPSRERLILKSVELHSPGFWEVLGSFNPLEVIRKYLGDVHERRKDTEYREAAERTRLDLENRILQTTLLQKEIEVAKSIGATEQDFAPLRNALLYDPLHRLENLQRRGLIDGADEIEPDSD